MQFVLSWELGQARGRTGTTQPMGAPKEEPVGSPTLSPPQPCLGNTHLPLGGFDEQHRGFIAFTARVEPAEMDRGWAQGELEPWAGCAGCPWPLTACLAQCGTWAHPCLAHPQGSECPGQHPGVGGHRAQALPYPLSHTQDPEQSQEGPQQPQRCPRSLGLLLSPPPSPAHVSPCAQPARPHWAGEASPLQAAAILGGGEEKQRGEEREALGDPGPDEAHLLCRDSAGAEVLHVHSQVEGRPARGGTSGQAAGPLCFSEHSPLQQVLSCSLYCELSANIPSSAVPCLLMGSLSLLYHVS